MTIRARVTLAILGAAAAVAVGAPLPALAPERACAAGDTRVAIVVDFGGLATTTATCVAAGSRDNGALLLAARASQLGRAAPRFNAQGLLCAIDGIPASGCGQAHGKKYAYWSYWHGSGQWEYESIGPAASRVGANVVEGWRWQPSGAGNPTDPAPRGSASATATCATQVAPPPTAAAPPPTKPPTATAEPTVAPLAPPDGGGTTTASTVSPASPTSASATSHSRPGVTVGEGEATTTIAASDLAAASAHNGSGGGGPPVGLIVGAALVAGLGAAGVVIARRRARATP